MFDYLHEEPLVHRVLGHAQPVQNDMSLECHLVPDVAAGVAAGPDGAGPEGAGDWLLVLQIDSDDDDADMVWGDCGRLYYWILRQDLKASRFDRTWCFFQCS